MTDQYWEGYQACKTELQDLMDKTLIRSPESRLVVVLAFLVGDVDDEPLG